MVRASHLIYIFCIFNMQFHFLYCNIQGQAFTAFHSKHAMLNIVPREEDTVQNISFNQHMSNYFL